MNNKGFTLIEILAVVVIMGIILIIAVPSVSNYISDSRKNSYINSAEGYVDSVIEMIASREISVRRKDTTYYIPIECISTEQGGKESPYGKWTSAYVVVTYDEDKYNYYWTSTDSAGMGVKLTHIDELESDSIEPDITSINTNIGVGNRDKIMIFKVVSTSDDEVTKCAIEKDKDGDQVYHTAENTTPNDDSGCPAYKTIKKQAVLDSISSTYVTSSSGINFGAAPGNTNGKGVYIRSGTENNTYPIYYYRGAVTNNNVIFANFCWKIVRTTDTGGIKLIYNGVPNGGKCNSTGVASTIGKLPFNDGYLDNAYVGYMYGDTGSSSYSSTHKNINDSTIKIKIDDWYKTNIDNKGYTKYLEDTVWCNDRSFANTNTGTGAGKSPTYYAAYERLTKSSSPSLSCKNANDRFTVNTKNGNGALTYPVALLTADEITLAGNGWSGYSNSTYLELGDYWWSLTPYGLANGFAAGMPSYVRLYNIGIDSWYGARPAISLKPGISFKTCSAGTTDDPYIIE